MSEIRPAALGDGDVIIRAVASLISRGTERLIWSGKVPENEYQSMRAPWQEGEFPFPVKYGYACAGEVIQGPDDLIGRTVFALYPHQTTFALPASAVFPADIPAPRLTLAANIETALNAIWDAAAGPGDRIAVIGGGVVGCLTAWLASRLPGADVTLVDPLESRRATAAALGVDFASDAGALSDCDLVFHASASADGLAAALGVLGPEGKLIEMSWYGEGAIPAPLGGAFHSKRLQIIATQVGQVSPSRRPRWSYQRRLAKAVELAADPTLDVLIESRVDFADLPARFPDIMASDALTALVDY
ncbi:MAG: zinc-binding alcohol dehydrogenase [Pseudomonadota bacterium]